MLPEKVLLLIRNQSDRRAVPFQCDLAPWLKSSSGRYQIHCYDMEGRLLKTLETAADWRGETPELEKSGIAIFEIITR